MVVCAVMAMTVVPELGAPLRTVTTGRAPERQRTAALRSGPPGVLHRLKTARNSTCSE